VPQVSSKEKRAVFARRSPTHDEQKQPVFSLIAEKIKSPLPGEEPFRAVSFAEK